MKLYHILILAILVIAFVSWVAALAVIYLTGVALLVFDTAHISPVNRGDEILYDKSELYDTD